MVNPLFIWSKPLIRWLAEALPLLVGAAGYTKTQKVHS